MSSGSSRKTFTWPATGRLTMGTQTGKILTQGNCEQGEEIGNVFTFFEKATLCLSVFVDDVGMVGRRKAELLCGPRCERTLLFADPTPRVDQVCRGCTQRAATVDEELVNANTGLFQRVTTSKVDGPHLRGLSHTTVSACSCDMRGHAEHCVER